MGANTCCEPLLGVNEVITVMPFCTRVVVELQFCSGAAVLVVVVVVAVAVVVVASDAEWVELLKLS